MLFTRMTVLFSLLAVSATAQMTPTLNEIWIPMRDGDSLSADVYIPTGTVEAEVILIQTPYNKNLFSIGLPMGVGQNLNTQPYIWVIVDWRGFYGSSNADLSDVNRGEDGYDVCEWIVNQAWHADRIGTWGSSALGVIQYQTAKEQHPNHTCAVPMVAHPQQAYDSYYYGGVLEKARLQQLDLLGYGLSPIVLSAPYYSTVWQFVESQSWYASDITIPTLQIGGWYDHNLDKMLDWYKTCRSQTPASVQDEQWLLIGPWTHGGTGISSVGTSVQGELSYPNAATVSNTMAWDFMNYYLLDATNNWQNTDKITYYAMGLDVWNSSNADEIVVHDYDILFLNDNGILSSSNVGGSSTSYVSDPRNPSPTIGGATLSTGLDQGPYDQVSLQGRNDIITFATDPLPADVSISGNIYVTVAVESDQPDCDMVVRLVDVYPDGRDMLITDGIHRMRFRNGYTQADETFMTPGTIYDLDIELAATNYTWKAGHRIKVYVGSNSSTRWDVNLQNGGQMYVAGDTNVANITVHHNNLRPSYMALPGNNPSLDAASIALQQLAVYPNPAQDVVFIRSEENIESVEIVDIAGRSVWNGSCENKQVPLDHLVSGTYLLFIHTPSGTATRTIVRN